METLHQSPTELGFVQDPYPLYDHARATGDLVYWADYKMPAAMGYDAVNLLLKDRRFGRERPIDRQQPPPPHLTEFHAVETHSMLEHDGDTHKRLRGLVLRAFTSRKIAGMAPEIEALCDQLIDAFPDKPFDLLKAYGTLLPVKIIARLLGVDDARAPDLLAWSNAMVAMYQAGRTRGTEDAANAAAAAFSAFMHETIAHKRSRPADDLITHLIAAEQDGETLSTAELIGTCILLLNAGHEATVHSLGNGVKCLIEHGSDPACLSSANRAATVEELLRFDPPLHMFTRFAKEPCHLFGHDFKAGDEVALVLAAANRDPKHWDEPDRFRPDRPVQTHTSLGAGAHFCVGAPLARLELQIGLSRLFERCPTLHLAAPTTYTNSYHFHGLARLMVQT